MSENEWLYDVEKQIDYEFENLDLLQQAFVRKTYALENGGGDNEILEFIGDRALEFAVTRYLMNEYGYLAKDTDDYDYDEDCNEYYSELSEGELSELKKRLVQKRTLAKRTEFWGWDKHLILGEGDKKNNVGEKESVKEDLFEAIIGAVAIDSNWNMDAIQNVVELALDPESELNDIETINYVSIVQDWYVSYYGKLPIFICEERKIGNGFRSIYSNNEGKYSCKIVLEDFDIHSNPKKMPYMIDYISSIPSINRKSTVSFEGCGNSKCEARRKLCKTIYSILEDRDLINTIKNEIENPNKDEAINQLETLSRRGYFSIPEYTFKEAYDQDGNPIWSVKCQIAEYSVIKRAKASSKKEAKKKAAFMMLKYVLEQGD